MIYIAIRSITLRDGDTLKVYETEPTGGNLTEKKSFTSVDAYYSLASTLLIKFTSDAEFTTYGFKMDFLVTKGMNILTCIFYYYFYYALHPLNEESSI